MSEPTDGPDRADGTDDLVGSVSEEAVKLFGALSDWARDHGSDLGQGLSGLVDHAAATAREVDEHLATGAAECTWCPICRTVHAVRRTSPEVRAHLASAASSLIQAAAGVLATAVPPEGRAGGHGSGHSTSSTGRDHGVEHIDLDEAPDGVWPEEDA